MNKPEDILSRQNFQDLTEDESLQLKKEEKEGRNSGMTSLNVSKNHENESTQVGTWG